MWELRTHSHTVVYHYSKGPLGVIAEALFGLVRVFVCISELSCSSCFASFDTIFGRHNRLSPKMIITE